MSPDKLDHPERQLLLDPRTPDLRKVAQ